MPVPGGWLLGSDGAENSTSPGKNLIDQTLHLPTQFARRRIPAATLSCRRWFSGGGQHPHRCHVPAV